MTRRRGPLLGDLARIAAVTTTAFMRATLDEPQAFVVRVLDRIPNKGQVMQRYYGSYSNRQRGARRPRRRRRPIHTGGAHSGASDSATADDTLTASRRQARLRWAELLRRFYEVDPLTAPSCGSEMPIVAALLEPKVIGKILAHIRDKGRDPCAGPRTRR